MRNLFIIILVASVMSSCGIYKKYQRPDVQTDSLYRDVSSSSDTSSLASLSWRELFTDPGLQQLIDQGLKSNTNLQIARLRVTQAEASLTSARLAFLPSVSLNPQGTINSFDNSKANKSYQLSASASWEIDVFGKLNNAKRGAKAAWQQSEAYEQAVQTQLIATIANSYYMLLMLDSQLRTSRLTASNWEQSIKTMRALKLAGRSTEAAIAQAEANYLSVQSSVLSIRQQINEMENSISTLLGQSAQAVKRGTLDAQLFPDRVIVGVPLQLLSNRPDVRQYEYALAQSFYATNQARSAFYPTITLGGSAGWTNSAGQSVLNPGGLLLSALGSLTQPLFNRGLNTARLKIAKAQQEEALLGFQQSLLDAGAQVNDALMQWQTSRAQALVVAEQIKYLQTAVKSTDLLMQHGTTTYLEVLTAQQSLLQAELSQLSIKFNEIQGVINLYHALGGGSK